MSAPLAQRDASPSLGAALAAAGAALGIDVSEKQSSRLLAFIDLLAHWNKTYNLTAVRDPAGMLTQHVVDCLAAVPALRRERRGGRVLDVGSGGGLPGIVWAIMAPDIDVTCVDSVGKKAAFIQQAAGSLELRNVHVEHARVEALRKQAFDVIASRAFASLADFVAGTSPLLKEGGVWMAMKGKTPAAEMVVLPSGVEVFHVEPLRVPGLDADRCLVWLRRTAQRSITDSTSEESMRSHPKQNP
ncbi:MAG: 16S rRNA (guanine(527)-N(7))-methyltransferase RsmG [Caldimonas sp.]